MSARISTALSDLVIYWREKDQQHRNRWRDSLSPETDFKRPLTRYAATADLLEAQAAENSRLEAKLINIHAVAKRGLKSFHGEQRGYALETILREAALAAHETDGGQDG